MASVTVVITNNLPELITLFAPQCNNPAFVAELKTNQPGKEFRLVIAPVAPLPWGTSQAQISLKTSSTNMPVINITALANVKPPVTINPPQIVLPAAPLARAQTNTLSLIDNSTNAIALSDLMVNATGVDVQLKEVLPGRSFAAILTFPQGFEVLPGQKVELSIKSSLPLMSVLRVPILQAPRPAPPKVAPIRVSSNTATNRHRLRPPVEMPPMPPQ
jgi:hypothetical protein